MNFASRFLSGIAKDAPTEPEKVQNPFPNGPRALKYRTHGQAIRGMERDRRGKERRADVKRRRDYFSSQHVAAVNRGWLIALDNVEGHSVTHLNAITNAMFKKFAESRKLDPTAESTIDAFAQLIFDLKEAYGVDLTRAATRRAA